MSNNTAEKEKKTDMSLCEKLECPVCLDYLEKPVRQCLIGHSFCTKCIDPQNIKECPECRSKILETRNYKLEELIENINYPCKNKEVGCPYMLKRSDLEEHELECQFRKLKCVGKYYCGWNCNWEGHKLLEHFREKHIENSSLEYNSTITIAYNNTSNFSDLQLISAHYHLFWYKHRIDLKKEMAYWAFQLIGLRKQMSNYYYEFEFFMDSPSIRKYKITEICFSDLDDINKIFESEKCVAISLKALKHYVNEKNEYSFRFRIMKIKKQEIPIEEVKKISFKKTSDKKSSPARRGLPRTQK